MLQAVDIYRLTGYIDTQAYLLVIQFHDPSKDNYTLFQKWLEMAESNAKYELKRKMLKNPTLKKLFDWKEDWARTLYNFRIAVKDGNLDMVKYLLKSGKSILLTWI